MTNAVDSFCSNVVAADDAVHAVCTCSLLLFCCLFFVDHRQKVEKIDTMNTTKNSKVDLFSCETKFVNIYVLLWFD